MRFLKNNLKVIIGFIVGVLLASSVTIYAYSYIANNIKYTKKDDTEISVADALNDLYSKANKTPTQVATLTTQGATYTMQNDGYILGTMGKVSGQGASLGLDGNMVAYLDYRDTDHSSLNISLYAMKGTVVSRGNQGIYDNLIIYEWK